MGDEHGNPDFVRLMQRRHLFEELLVNPRSSEFREPDLVLAGPSAALFRFDHAFPIENAAGSNRTPIQILFKGDTAESKVTAKARAHDCDTARVDQAGPKHGSRRICHVIVHSPEIEFTVAADRWHIA